ncbi:MAG TPA: DUF1802 family protein [Chloroflexota bacterium]|nr:DUF1802 family protein [Chloroflexota bacterium]
MDPEELTTQHALKEWAVAIDALRTGEALITVRKGGIREEAREFRMEHRAFALFPTFDHQNVEQLRPQYAERLGRVVTDAAGAGRLRVDAWAEVTDVLEVRDEEQVHALESFYVFSRAYALERLQWRPKKPLHVLLLRVYRLEPPLEMPLLASYGGCKSWIELAVPVPLDRSRPVLDDAAFAAARARALASALASNPPPVIC